MVKPRVLLLGATGQVGKLIAEEMIKDTQVTLRVTSRHKEQLPELQKRYGEAAFLDLADPRTFDEALKGVQRVFLLTGYSYTMLTQSKTFVDAAKKAGVEHIVHLGVFSLDWDCSDSHFAWHQLVEAYIKQSQLKWTFLHPNCFMQNLTGFYSFLKNDKLVWYIKDKPCGWIALEDVAEATAKILNEGPTKHHGKDYWFSTESLTADQMAQILTSVTGEKFSAEIRPMEQFIKDLTPHSGQIDPYFLGVADFFYQLRDGRMDYVGCVKDDLPQLIGRKGMTLKEWARLHKDELLQKRMAVSY